MSTRVLITYFDYKSPYAYLAQDAVLALPRELDVEVVPIPYTLDIPSYLGSAEVDAAGTVVHSDRNEHQWRRVRYSYMDCRREASRRGIVLRGPRKIFDSSIAHIGFLYAQARAPGNALDYHLAVYERFWRRELDIEDPQALRRVLEEAGVPAEGFGAYLEGEGRTSLERRQVEAEAQGVFGVPSYLLDGELFWGQERLERVRERLAGGRAGA